MLRREIGNSSKSTTIYLKTRVDQTLGIQSYQRASQELKIVAIGDGGQVLSWKSWGSQGRILKITAAGDRKRQMSNEN